MKKILTSIAATAMALGLSVTALAAPIYENDGSLKNTVTGFAGGQQTLNLDITEVEGPVNVEFNLGDNAPHYNVEIDVREGGKKISAEYSKAKNALILDANVDLKQKEAVEYEIGLQVVNRKTKDVIAEGYVVNGEISYDKVQSVESDERYNNKNGSIYDFEDGASNVQINVGHDVTLQMKRTPKGTLNLHVTTEGNESINYMFAAHELSYLNFVSRPKFSSAVEVRVEAPEDSYLYSYVDSTLKKVDAQYEEDGFVFTTKELGTLILADKPMTEGAVDESINLVKPGTGSGNSGSGNGSAGSNGSSDKNNPTTGASDGVGAAMGIVSLAAAAALAIKKRK